MIGIRQLLIIALVIVGIWLFRRLQQRLSANRPRRPTRQPVYQETVRCAHCGAHLLRSKAISGPEEDYFCTKAHQLAGREAPNGDSNGDN